jgi:hypothetical protein
MVSALEATTPQQQMFLCFHGLCWTWAGEAEWLLHHKEAHPILTNGSMERDGLHKAGCQGVV